LDPTNPSVTLQTLERAASAVGRRLDVRLEETGGLTERIADLPGGGSVA